MSVKVTSNSYRSWGNKVRKWMKMELTFGKVKSFQFLKLMFGRD